MGKSEYQTTTFPWRVSSPADGCDFGCCGAPITHRFDSIVPNVGGPTDFITAEIRYFCTNHAELTVMLTEDHTDRTYTYNCVPTG